MPVKEPINAASSGCGVAASLADKVSSIMMIAEKRLAEKAERGETVTIEPVDSLPHELPPVVAKNIERLGLLPRDLPSRVVAFYTL
jgi:hypothetical protein